MAFWCSRCLVSQRKPGKCWNECGQETTPKFEDPTSPSAKNRSTTVEQRFLPERMR